MASYKDLSKTQINRINKLSRYGMVTKVIANKVNADANQVYQYFKVNVICPYQLLSRGTWGTSDQLL